MTRFQLIKNAFKMRIIRPVKFVLLFTFFIISFVYTYLAIYRHVPSIFHVPVIRKIWDKQYSECVQHQEQQKNSPNKRLLYLTISAHGRFANRMFQFASLIGIARKNNRIPYVSPDFPLFNAFRLNISTLKDSQLPKCLDLIQDHLPCTYDSKMESLPYANLSLHGYIQSWKYFDGYEDEIRSQFRLNEGVLADANNILNEYISSHKKTDLYICVHVRMTDMMIPSSTRLGFKAAPLEYILNAMSYMRKKFNNASVTFVTVSDDYYWCKNYLNYDDVISIPQNSREIDFAILTKCNHSIITTGTFGWWGAWLAGGHTVYYSNYPEVGSKLDREMNKKDFYPREWIAIGMSSCLKCDIKLVLFSSFVWLLFVIQGACLL